MLIRYDDRRDAGRRLAADPWIARFAGREDVVVLALPRGGVPVAYEIAMALGAPLDVFVVRELGLPDHEELAMGAVATGGIVVLDRDLIRRRSVPQAAIDAAIAAETREIARREAAYRGDRAFPDLRGRVVLVVDDGLATGATMLAATRALARAKPARLVAAVPVCASSSCSTLEREVDEIVCLEKPEPFHGVGLWYVDFSQTTDDEVRALLAQAAQRDAPVPGSSSSR